MDRKSSGKKAETISVGGETYRPAERRRGPTGRVDVQTVRETRRLAENTCRQAVILVDRQWYFHIGSDTCRVSVILAERQ
jgi:hypothetical protein